MLGALAARRGGQKPAVRDGTEPHLGERLVRLGRRVRVAERLVGDQQVPRDRLQVGRVAVEHAVRSEHDPRAVAEFAVEAPDLPGDLPVVGEHEQLDVRRERWQSAARGAACELLAPLSEQPALSDDEPAEPGLRGGAVRERPPGADRLAGADGRCVDAGSDDLERGHLALAAEQHRVVGQRSRERHPHHLSRPGRQRHVRPGALQREQLGDRLLGDHSAGACGDAVGGGDREHPGPALHPPDAHRVLQLSGRLGREQQAAVRRRPRSARPRRGPSPRSGARTAPRAAPTRAAAG